MKPHKKALKNCPIRRKIGFSYIYTQEKQSVLLKKES
jgi:hypothetical protein